MGRLIRALANRRYVEHWARREARAFGKHVATYRLLTPHDAQNDARLCVEMLTWKEPGTGIHRVDYLCDGPHLSVTGDLGDAIYEAGMAGIVDWARCSIDYFASKCVASEHGRGYRTWDAAAARLAVRERLSELRADARLEFRDRFGWSALSSQFEWQHWLSDHGSDVLGDEYYEDFDIGTVTSDRCELHLRGLKLAVDRLAATDRAIAERVHRGAAA